MFAFIICLLFTLGDVNQVTNTPTGVPLIEVYYQAAKPKGATTFLALMPTLIVFLAVFNVFASSSRLICVFSKDKGLPFSNIFSTVSYLNNKECNEY
jgi:amino acid transporter